MTSTAGGAPNVTLTKQLRAAGIKVTQVAYKGAGPALVDVYTARANRLAPTRRSELIQSAKRLGFVVPAGME